MAGLLLLVASGPAVAATYDDYSCVKHTSGGFPGYSLSRSALGR